MILTRRIFACFGLLVVFALSIFNTAQAKSQAELTNINAYEVDDKTLRLEIEYKGKLNDSDYLLRTSGDYLIVDLYNTMPGRINKIAGKSVAADTIEKITVGEFKINQTRITFKLKNALDENNCDISLQPANRAEKKSARVVIDIAKDNVISEENFSVEDKVVVIDAGHGGSDKGAVGLNGVTEKSVTLAVALKVERLLQESGAKVIMTRRTDIDVASASASDVQELQARVNKTPPSADIFISIHCNAFSNPKSNGMETLYYSGSRAGRKLAELLNEELANYGGRLNRGVKVANFYVLKHSNCPASLVELAFVTNPTEESLLADESYQQELAKAIAVAVNRYFNE